MMSKRTNSIIIFVLIFLLSISLVNGFNVLDRLDFYLEMEDATDSTGGHYIENQNAMPFNVMGKHNYAGNPASAATQRLVVFGAKAPQNYTCRGWVNISGAGSGSREGLFGSSNVAGNDDIFVVEKDAANRFHAMYQSAGTFAEVTTAGAYNDDTYHHLVVVRQDDLLRFLLDGVLVGTDLGDAGQGVLNQNITVGSLGFAGLYADVVDIDEVACFNYSWNVSEALADYNSGVGVFFEQGLSLTLINYYNSSSLTTFTANITNSSNPTGTTIHTTNGTIEYSYGQVVNITIFNITGSEGVFFNRTYTDVNSSNPLQAMTWQSIVYTYAEELYTNSSLCNFNLSIGTQANTSTNCFTTHYVDSGLFNYSGKQVGYETNSSGNITLSPLETVNQTIYFYNNIINVTAYDNYTLDPILSFNITIEGRQHQTTTGNITGVYCNLNLTNISISSYNYLSTSILHNTSNSTANISMQSLISYFHFINGQDNQTINNATITITPPSGSSFQLLTNSTGGINFSNNNVFGQYTITFEAQQGYISPLSFYVNITAATTPVRRNFTISQAVLRINIYDRETGDYLNKPTNVILFGYFNTTVNNGSLDIYNLTIESGTHTIQALSSGYGAEQKQVTFSNQEELTIDFYLLNVTGSNTGTLYVSTVDEFYRTISEAYVTLLEYDAETTTYKSVSECLTNSNGECQFYIELNVKTYILTASKTISGYEYSDTTNPEIIKSNNEVRQLFLTYSPQTSILNIYGLFFNATEMYDWDSVNKSLIIAYFSTMDGSTAQLCLRYLEDNTQTYLTCLNASTGILIGAEQTLNRTKDYEAELYLLTSTNTKFHLISFYYPSEDSLESILSLFKLAKPIVLFLWLIILVVSLWLKNVTLYGFLAIILSFVEIIVLFPNILFMTGTVLKFIIGLFIIDTARKRQDSG